MHYRVYYLFLIARNMLPQIPINNLVIIHSITLAVLHSTREFPQKFNYIQTYTISFLRNVNLYSNTISSRISTLLHSEKLLQQTYIYVIYLYGNRGALMVNNISRNLTVNFYFYILS